MKHLVVDKPEMNFSNTSLDPFGFNVKRMPREKENVNGLAGVVPPPLLHVLFCSWHAFAIEAILASVASPE